MIRNGLPLLAIFSRSGSRSLRELIFFSWMRMYALSNETSRLSAFVTK